MGELIGLELVSCSILNNLVGHRTRTTICIKPYYVEVWCPACEYLHILFWGNIRGNNFPFKRLIIRIPTRELISLSHRNWKFSRWSVTLVAESLSYPTSPCLWNIILKVAQVRIEGKCHLSIFPMGIKRVIPCDCHYCAGFHLVAISSTCEPSLERIFIVFC